MPTAVAVPRDTVHKRVGRVLDSLAITDIVYHDFEYTRPLVEEVLFRLVNQVERGGKVLVIGANTLLAQCVLDAGYDLHLWRFGENLLSDDIEEQVRGRLTPEMLAHSCLPFGDERFDGVVLPLIFEHVPASPAAVLRALTPHLRRDGVVVTATHNLGVVHTRRRALLGKPFLPGWRTQETAFSYNWPDLQPYRFYLPDELRHYGRQAGLHTLEWGYVLGHTAFNNADFLSLRQYGALKAKHLLHRLVPPLREYVVLTYARPTAEERRTGAMPAGSSVAPVPEEPEAKLPLVSVALPTHNRSAMLRDTFAGLAVQTYPVDRFEVLVINDGSTDDTASVATELIAGAPFPARYIETRGVGATAARNLGMREARGEIVAHLDDDCRPCPEWLEEGVRGFVRDEVAIVAGPVVPKPEQPTPFFSLTAYVTEENGTYPTANIFYRREPALAAGGFDESFGGNLLGRPVPGWDSDLAWRLRRAGYQARFRRGAVAYMEVFNTTPRDWVLHGWRMIHVPMSVKRVPELKMLLVHGLFAHESTFYFDLALAGAATASIRRHPAPLLLTALWAGWWARSAARRDMWPPQRWPVLGAKLGFVAARQGVALAALLTGSVQERRLVI
jgi:glycosyltransferase involved in cell wall biosynthesis/SAM-dependent methyltransferase